MMDTSRKDTGRIGARRMDAKIVKSKEENLKENMTRMREIRKKQGHLNPEEDPSTPNGNTISNEIWDKCR